MIYSDNLKMNTAPLPKQPSKPFLVDMLSLPVSVAETLVRNAADEVQRRKAADEVLRRKAADCKKRAK